MKYLVVVPALFADDWLLVGNTLIHFKNYFQNRNSLKPEKK